MRGKRTIFFIFLCSLFISFYSYGQHCDTIFWKGFGTLHWKHFKGNPDYRSPASALSESSIVYGFTVANNLIHFRFSSNFSTCGSWIKSTTTYRLLEHEQVHFDLVEYHKRLMVKEVLSQQFTPGNFVEKIQAIAKRIITLRVEADALYDGETNFSRNEEKQNDWQRKIRKMVRSLDDYERSGYLVKIN